MQSSRIDIWLNVLIIVGLCCRHLLAQNSRSLTLRGPNVLMEECFATSDQSYDVTHRVILMWQFVNAYFLSTLYNMTRKKRPGLSFLS